MIVKVQRPLASSVSDDSACLVYPESRRAMTQQPVPPDVMKVLLDRPGGKAYFQAGWNATTQMYVIGIQVRDQDW